MTKRKEKEKKKNLHKSLFCIKYPFVDTMLRWFWNVFGSIEWKIDGKYVEFFAIYFFVEIQSRWCVHYAI